MRRFKRGVHLDFHTMPGIEDFGKDWDPIAFAQTLKDAHVECINVFAQCNLGFSYYNTKVGIKYPGLKEDMLEGIVRECHARGIKVMAYISNGLNHEQSFRHPEWSLMDEEGRIIWGDRTANFFRMPCFNTGYKEYMISVIHEVLEYGVDGLFFDSVTVRPCYCHVCTEKMMERGIDITDKAAVIKFAYETALEYTAAMKAEIPEGKSVRFNGVPEQPTKDYHTHAEIECLPTGAWGYDFFPASVAYARNLHEDVMYMTGRFQSSWGDFGGFRSKASIENDFYDALVAGVPYSLGDHMHPRCRLEQSVYDMYKEINEDLIRYEPWTDDACYEPQIAAIVNLNKAGEVNLDSPGTETLTDSYSGLARMLGELKYTYDIINEEMDFSKYELLIMPDNVKMTDGLAIKLKEYLDNGGKVLSTGVSGLNRENNAFALQAWDFLTFDGMDDTTRSYYKKVNTTDEFTWAMYASGIKMMSTEETILAEYVKPYFTRHYDGRHGYFYTPPKESTGHAAVAGNGIVEHISFRIFDAYYNCASGFHKQLVKEAIERLLPNALVKAEELPSTARIGVTATNKYKLLHIKVTYPETRGKANIIEEHAQLPAGKKVAIRGIYENVKHLPEMSSLKSWIEDGYTYVVLPEITGFAMIMFE